MRRNKSPLSKIFDFIERHERKISWVLLALSIIVLIGSSLYVGQKSGLIQTNNHDNLIDNYLFENKETFQNALFPAAHTFLLKWPIFALSAQFGNTQEVYVIGTMAMYLLTVIGFMVVVFFLSRKNLLVTSLVGLMFSAILMMVPAQPIDGTLLPLNMAMITTRNIEFLFLFAFIYLILKAKKILSWQFITSVIVLGLLGATDKYYLMIELVAAALYIGFHFSPLNKNKGGYQLSVFLPLIAGAISYLFANALLLAIDSFGITNIPNSTKTAPFALIGSVWQMFEATAGAIQGMLANFGANIFGKNLGLSILPNSLNGLLFIAACYCAYLLLSKRVSKNLQQTTTYKYVLWLILIFIGSFVIFIASDHSYLVDGRYLTTTVFAGLASVALVLGVSKFKSKNNILILMTVVALLIMPIYALVARQNYARSFSTTYAEIGERIESAAEIAKQHDVAVFAGDYWFVSPVRLKAENSFEPVLMSTDVCDETNSFLTSTSWHQPDENVKTSALYILKDADETNNTYNHGCTIDYLNNKYGEPEFEYIIRGTFEDPIDIIRIYPYDIREKLHQ